MPALQASEDALNKLDKKAIAEVKVIRCWKPRGIVAWVGLVLGVCQTPGVGDEDYVCCDDCDGEGPNLGPG